jgi:hypothetical protein
VGAPVTDTHTLNIVPRTAFLPLVFDSWPPPPPHLTVKNRDIDDCYNAEWNSKGSNVCYALEEGKDSSFSDKTTHTTQDTSYSFDGKEMRRYYYRVCACDATCQICGVWSNVVQTYPWHEEEEDDSYVQANGPLLSGREYHGWLDSDAGYDYYRITPSASGRLVADLVIPNSPGLKMQLQLRDERGRQLSPPVYDPEPPPLHIEYDVPRAGTYYLRVCPKTGYQASPAYTLSVTLP